MGWVTRALSRLPTLKIALYPVSLTRIAVCQPAGVKRSTRGTSRVARFPQVKARARLNGAVPANPVRGTLSRSGTVDRELLVLDERR